MTEDQKGPSRALSSQAINSAIAHKAAPAAAHSTQSTPGRKAQISWVFLHSLRQKTQALHYIEVRIDHNSGKKRSSSAFVKYATPLLPPVPRL
jgi:hypothetical protein